MKAICINGAIPHDLDLISGLLQQAGMDEARPSERDEKIDFAWWHQQLTIQLEPELQAYPDAPPGRFWEQLASDLFLANMGSPFWGWMECASTRYLEFWKNFDLRVQFILVTTRPERLLAQALIANTVDTESNLLKQWQEQHLNQLRFHHRNPQRSLLVDVEQVMADPGGFLGLIAAQLNLGGQLPANPTLVHATMEPDELALFISRQLMTEHPEIQSLSREIGASLTPFPSNLPESAADCAAQPASKTRFHASLVQAYRRLRDNTDKEMRILQLEKDSSLLETSLVDLRQLLNQTQTLATQREQLLAAQLQEQQEESATLLQQLHQVQQELESRFRREGLESQQQEEREQIVGALKKQLEDSRILIETLTKENVSLKSGATQTNVLTTALAKSEFLLGEQKQENELLLLQLQKVQEELEHFFGQYREVVQKHKAAEARWKDMLHKNPGYAAFSSLELINADAAGNHTWLFKGLHGAGRSFPDLRFNTCIRNGVVGLVFRKQDRGILQRWPALASTESVTLITPLNFRPGNPDFEILHSLGPSDLLLVDCLARLLEEALTLDTYGLPDISQLKMGLEQLRMAILELPKTLRYDKLILKREQVNPDYEHLWINIVGLSMNGKTWAEFDFRLSCADLHVREFGTRPKLEFPDGKGRALLQHWFAESQDDLGPKLELRYALPSAMDLDIWHRLSEQDRSFLAMLISRLPEILKQMESDGITLRRPWKDWSNMASAILQITDALDDRRASAVQSNRRPTPADQATHPKTEIPVLQPSAPNQSGTKRLTPKTGQKAATKTRKTAEK